MDFNETSEQTLLRDSVRRFAAKAHHFHGGKKPDSNPAAHWRDVAANGWTAVALSEQAGGVGLSPVEMAIVMEEFGRGLVVEPFISCIVLAARAIDLLGDVRQRKLLMQVIDGDILLALAHEEGESGAASEIAAVAERDRAGWRINGKKICVYGAGEADMLVVSARTSGKPGEASGVSLFLAPANASGVERTHYRTIDGFEAADIAFSDLIVPSDALLGAAGEAAPALEDVIDLGNVAICAEAVGIMERAVELTRDYAKLRRQFGQPIGSFQAIQHRLADMFAELEMSRSALHYALASRFGSSRSAQSQAASGCKTLIARAGRFVCENAIQIHGGVGMADESEIGHYYRRLLAIEATLGDADFHFQRFAAFA